MAERLFTSPMTSDDTDADGGREHQVTDEKVLAGLHGNGAFLAICGTTFLAASLMRAPGRPCPRCRQVARLLAETVAIDAAEQPHEVIPEQTRGRHRRGALALLTGDRR